MHGSTSESYRKTSQWLNRVRYQPVNGTPSRTLQDSTQREGTRVLAHLQHKSERILSAHQFSTQGVPLARLSTPETAPPAQLSSHQVLSALEHCGKTELIRHQMQANPLPYEAPEHTVNISMDDVGVKRQKAHRPAPDPASDNPRKYAYQTVVHLETQTGCYRFNAVGLSITLSILVAFLLHNDLLNTHLVIFADGQRSLHAAILNTLSWVTSLQLILDWYHLRQKCKLQLSLACRGKLYRNQHLARLMTLLWHGLVDAALTYLDFLDPNHLKDEAALERLKGYLRRHQPHIPCYSVRKQLGLRNSSNLGEKSNDLLVSARQKHNGMSWSKTGSAALAAITALVFNQEYLTWFRTGDLNFRLVPHTAI